MISILGKKLFGKNVIELFSYFLERGVCYLVLTEKSFSKRLAFSYLEDLQTEFVSQYGAKVDTVSRPYSFIQFGKLPIK